MLSGPLPQEETAKLASESFVFADEDPLVDQMKTRWSIELYTSHCSVFETSEKNTENSPDTNQANLPRRNAPSCG